MKRGFGVAPHSRGSYGRYTGRGGLFMEGRGRFRGGHSGHSPFHGAEDLEQALEDGTEHLLGKGQKLPLPSLWEHVATAVQSREGYKKDQANDKAKILVTSGIHGQISEAPNCITGQRYSSSRVVGVQDRSGKAVPKADAIGREKFRMACPVNLPLQNEVSQEAPKPPEEDEEHMEDDTDEEEEAPCSETSHNADSDRLGKDEIPLFSGSDSEQDPQDPGQKSEEEGMDSDSDNEKHNEKQPDDPKKYKEQDLAMGETPFTFKSEDSRKRIKERKDVPSLDKRNKIQLFPDFDKEASMLAELCNESSCIRSERNAIKVKLDQTEVLKCLQDNKQKSVLLYFMGRVVSSHQLYAWAEVAVGPNAFSRFSYLGKGIYLGMCSENAIMYRLLERAGIWGAGLFALALPWDPLFDPDKEFMRVCPVWVTIRKFPAYLWPLAAPLIEAMGKILHKPKMDLGMTPRDIRICVLWEMAKEIPDRLEIDIGMVHPLCLALHFSSFPHACYRCKQVGHFAKDCSSIKPKSPHQEKEEGRNGEQKEPHVEKVLEKEGKIEIVIPITREGTARKEERKPKEPTYDELLAKYRIPAILKKGRKGKKKLVFSNGYEIGYTSYLTMHNISEKEAILDT